MSEKKVLKNILKAINKSFVSRGDDVFTRLLSEKKFSLEVGMLNLEGAEAINYALSSDIIPCNCEDEITGFIEDYTTPLANDEFIITIMNIIDLYYDNHCILESAGYITRK